MRAEETSRHLLELPCPEIEPAPWRVPSAAPRVALVSTAGLMHRGDIPFGLGGADYRVIDANSDTDVVMSHISTNFDRTGFAADLNVVFPLQRLQEMAAAEQIGSVARYHYSFMGCTRAVCALAHYFEHAGIATLVLGLVPQHVQKMKPPRALSVPFQLGRPLGAPGDMAFQQKVLDAAFGLLTHPGPEPINTEFTYDAPVSSASQADQWACPVSFPDPDQPAAGDDADPGANAAALLRREVQTLVPWFERARASNGRTLTATSGRDIDGVCDLLLELQAGVEPTGIDASLGLAQQFKLAVEDLKMFYIEAMLAQPAPPDPQAQLNWFWQETRAGELLLGLHQTLANHPDKRVKAHAAFTLVPVPFRPA